MTITTEDNIAGPYAGDGSTVAFATPHFQKNEDIRAILVTNSTGAETVQTLTTHYTLAGALVPDGGTLTMVTPPAVGETLYITVDPEQTQEAIIAASNATTQALDKLTQEIQAIQLDVDRSLKVSESSRLAGPVNTALPATTDRANASLGFSASGDVELRFDGGPVLDASFTYSPTTHAGKYILLDVDSAAVVMTLPDVTTVPDGHNFTVYVNSNLNLASITVAVSGQMRSINGYSTHDEDADTVFIGLSTAEQKSHWVRVERVSNNWRVVGLLRQNSGDDLSYSTGGGGGGGAVDSVVGQTGDVTAAQIATALNSEGDANLMSDAQETKLDGVESGATADQSDGEIETAYNSQVSIISQAEAEAGTATTARRWTAQRVAQAIAALGGGGSSAASGVSVTGTPSNHSPLAANVQAYLDSIDTALGSAGLGTQPTVPDFTVTAATSVADTKTALQAGGWVHFQRDVTQDWNAFGLETNLTNDLLWTMDDGVVIQLDGAADSLADRVLNPRANIKVRGGTFENGGVLFNLHDLDTTASLDCYDVKLSNCGALVFANQPNSNVGARLSNLIVQRCEAGNGASLVNVRCGDGASDNLRCDFALITDNVGFNLSSSFINVAFDDGLGAGNYPSNSLAFTARNQCTGITGAGGSAAAFGYHMSAYETWVSDTDFIANVANGTRSDLEGFYNKSAYVTFINPIGIDAAQSQGMIALKGGLNVARATILGGSLTSTSSLNESGVWYQCSDITIDGLVITGQFGNAAVSGQTSIAFSNHIYRNMKINVTNVPSFGALLHVRGNVDGLTIENNEIISDTAAAGNIDLIKIRAGATLTIADPIVRWNRLKKNNAGTIRGVTFDKDAGGGDITNGRVLDNIMFDLDVGIRTEDQTITLISEGNRGSNVTTPVNNANGSTITTETTF